MFGSIGLLGPVRARGYHETPSCVARLPANAIRRCGTKVIVSWDSGMNLGKYYFQNSPCCSRFVALALHKERLHLFVLQDLHGGLLGSVAPRDREERLLRLRHHRAREIVLVD